MLQSSIKPAPRLSLFLLLILGFALPAASGHADTKENSPAPIPKSAAAIRRPPLDSVSELTKYIETLKAAHIAKKGERDEDEHSRVKPGSRPVHFNAKPVKRTANPSKASGGEDPKEEDGTDWLQAYRFYIKQRAYPNDKVDWGAIRRAAKKRNALPPAHLRPVSSTPTNTGKPGGSGPVSPGESSPSSRSSLSAPLSPGGSKWEFIGPKNLAVPYQIYYGQGATSGRVNAVAFTTPVKGQPDTTANTIYAGSAGGGVWKSANGGATWTPLSDGWPSLAVSSIAVDPTNPNKVYVGTGDFQGYGVYPFGMMRSTNGGATWTNSGQDQFGTTSVSHVVVDPESPNIVTVSTGHGIDFLGYVWRSTDSGATWTMAFNSPNAWSGLTISAPDSLGNRIYYAAAPGEIKSSGDRGVNWTTVNLPSGASLPTYPDIATSKTDPNTVYLLSPGDQNILKSTDAGTTWTDITGAFPGGYNYSQGYYDFHITTSSLVDRFKKVQDAVYVGLIDVDQSPNGGGLWRSMGLSYTDQAITHNDQHAMAVNPRNPNDMLVGNDGGLYRLTYNPTRDTWSFDTSPNKTLGITQFYHAAFHPYDASKMLGGTQDNATPISFGDLGNWKNVAGGDGGFAEIHPLAPNVQYATVYFGTTIRTTNGWNSSFQLNTGSGFTGFFAPIAVDTQDSSVLYWGSDTVWKYKFANNGGYTLSQLTPTLSNLGVMSYIAVSPSDSNRIYAASDVGELFMTTDGGKKWTEIDQGTPSLPNRYITSVTVDPDNPSRVIVTVSGTGSSHVWRCDDAAAKNRSWTDVSSGLPDVPANTVALDMTDSANTYYVGTDVGAFVTQNGGSSWSDLSQPLGLPNVQVNELRTVYGTGYLNAATYGRGMWRIRIANPIAPVTSITTIPTTAHGGATVTISITLLSPAPLGGQVVNLQSSNLAVFPVPASVPVVAGFNIKQLPVATAKVTKNTTVTITATAGGKSRSTKLLITP